MKKKILALFLATTMAVGLLAGCGNSNTKNETKTEDTANKSGDGTFTMAIDYMPDSLKPSGAGTDSFTTMIRPLYQSLFYQTGSGREYYLADSVEVSEDGLTYTVHLNDDATSSFSQSNIEHVEYIISCPGFSNFIALLNNVFCVFDDLSINCSVKYFSMFASL